MRQRHRRRPETCDDGNVVNGDGCDSPCQPTGCGSGVVTGIEQCDDGNLANGDGCSQLCQREFLNPTAAAGDHYGFSVATIGTNLLVGAPEVDQPAAINTGRAYLIHGDTGVTLRTFLNPTPGAGDGFGFAVAALGGNVLVGAPFDDTAGPDAGAVYLFNGATGALIKTFTNPPLAPTTTSGGRSPQWARTSSSVPRRTTPERAAAVSRTSTIPSASNRCILNPTLGLRRSVRIRGGSARHDDRAGGSADARRSGEWLQPEGRQRW